MTEITIKTDLNQVGGGGKWGLFGQVDRPRQVDAILPGDGVMVNGDWNGLRAWASPDPIEVFDIVDLTFALYKDARPGAEAMVVDCIYGDLIPYVNLESVAHGNRLQISFMGTMQGIPKSDIYSRDQEISIPFYPDPLRVGDRVYLTYELKNRSHQARLLYHALTD